MSDEVLHERAQRIAKTAQEKAAADALYEQMGKQQQTTGAIGLGPYRPSLRERLASQRCRAQQEARNHERLMELEYLLDKHPEVARILDLLDSVKE